MNDKLALIADWIQNSERIVFFGGAGVSTESGIPDFRSDTGMYKRKYSCNKKEVTAEECLSIDFARRHQDIFYDYYLHEFVHPDARPNDAHIVLAQLEEMGKLSAVITQNCDSLHQKAGSKHVIELHGSTASYSCECCQKKYSHQDVVEAVKKNRTAVCTCGGFVRPDIVFYGEPLPEGVFERAAHYVAQAEVFLVAGTSLNVYPAASLMHAYRGNKCVLINLQATPYDDIADCVVHEKCGSVLKQILNRIK